MCLLKLSIDVKIITSSIFYSKKINLNIYSTFAGDCISAESITPHVSVTKHLTKATTKRLILAHRFRGLNPSCQGRPTKFRPGVWGLAKREP